MLVDIFGGSDQHSERTRTIDWHCWNTLIVNLVLMTTQFVGR